jgi:PIN domain nuclease of toxin-antitoxin system
MILIDTHIFIWLASYDSNLKQSFRTVLENETEIAISVI